MAKPYGLASQKLYYIQICKFRRKNKDYFWIRALVSTMTLHYKHNVTEQAVLENQKAVMNTHTIHISFTDTLSVL